ncbi:MAG: cytidylate kinase-like family protein [Eubacteriales bacterium]|nr:cytidylate kinase-like family protein [Eubacteriales bacterium]
MARCRVITIGRQYGSGGREIGEKLAEKLGYTYYDTILLDKAAKDSGLTESIIARYDEKLADKWLNISLGMHGSDDIQKLPVPLRAVIGQFEAIRKIGQQGSAVIVGRCADHVLREDKNVLSVFIYAGLGQRIARVAERNDISRDEARKRIRNTDKKRAAYYEYYTDKEWGKSESYHLCIDSGFFGIDGTVEVLSACIQQQERKEDSQYK